MLPPIPFSEQVNPPEQTDQGNKTYLFQQLKPNLPPPYSSTICLFQVVMGGGPLNCVTNAPVPEFTSSYFCSPQWERTTTPGSFPYLSFHSGSVIVDSFIGLLISRPEQPQRGKK